RSAALANAGGLTAQVAQVVELGTADPAAGGDLDLLEHRAVHREGPLHSDGVADLADGEGLADSRPLPPDHHALEDLDTGPVALGDPNVDVQRVARTEVRHVGAQLGLLKLLNGGVHLSGSSSTARRADGLRSRGRICWVEYVVPVGPDPVSAMKPGLAERRPNRRSGTTLTSLPQIPTPPVTEPPRGPRDRAGQECRGRDGRAGRGGCGRCCAAPRRAASGPPRRGVRT